MSDRYEVIEKCKDHVEAANRTRFQIGRKAIITGLNISSSGRDYVVIPDFELLPLPPKEEDINLYTYREAVRETIREGREGVRNEQCEEQT